MHYVDVLTMRGCTNAEAVLVNGNLVRSQGETDIEVGARIEPESFFPALEAALAGESFHLLEHELNLTLLRLDPSDWQWEEVIEKAGDSIAKAVRKAAGLRALQIVRRHGNDWVDGYTSESAAEVLEALNEVVAIARVDADLVLGWAENSQFGPTGDSDLYLVALDGNLYGATEAYQLVNGQHKYAPFLDLLEGVQAGLEQPLTVSDRFLADPLTELPHQVVF